MMRIRRRQFLPRSAMKNRAKSQRERTELTEHREMVYEQGIQNLIDKAVGINPDVLADPDWVRYRWGKLKRIREGK